MLSEWGGVEIGSTMMYQPEFNEKRFGDLMLYLAHRCRDADYFGSTKLCKLLYYSDFTAFARTGQPITGADYIRQEHGPMPKDFYQQRNRLTDCSLAQMELRLVFSHEQDRLVPLVDESYFDGLFSQPELDAIEGALDMLKEMTAKEASEHSHGEVGWIIAKDGATIPYEAAYLVPETDTELRRVVDAAVEKWVLSQDGR